VSSLPASAPPQAGAEARAQTTSAYIDDERDPRPNLGAAILAALAVPARIPGRRQGLDPEVQRIANPATICRFSSSRLDPDRLATSRIERWSVEPDHDDNHPAC